LSEYAKKLAERGALTLWRRQRKGFVRTQEETNHLRVTHSLEMAKEDLSGHGKKQIERGALTS
jgi:hypothetical protein